MEDLNCWQTKFIPCKYAKQLLTKITLLNQQTNLPVDLKQIKKAIYYAKKYHGNQQRDSGEPYYSHPLAVAASTADYIFDTNAITAAILHDIIEDTNIIPELITKLFNPRVFDIVIKLTRNRLGGKQSAQQLLLHSYRENDPVAATIKLLDRLDNLKTIYIKSPEKQLKTKIEVLESFFLLSFKLDKTINKMFCDYLLSSCVTQTQEQACFSYGDFQLAPLDFQNNF